MANHKSAAKRARQDIKKRSRNLSTKSSVKTLEKKLKTAIEAKDTANLTTMFSDFTSKLDKAAQKGVFHVKAAARKVSRLSKQISSIK